MLTGAVTGGDCAARAAFAALTWAESVDFEEAEDFEGGSGLPAFDRGFGAGRSTGGSVESGLECVGVWPSTVVPGLSASRCTGEPGPGEPSTLTGGAGDVRGGVGSGREVLDGV